VNKYKTPLGKTVEVKSIYDIPRSERLNEKTRRASAKRRAKKKQAKKRRKGKS